MFRFSVSTSLVSSEATNSAVVPVASGQIASIPVAAGRGSSGLAGGNVVVAADFESFSAVEFPSAQSGSFG